MGRTRSNSKLDALEMLLGFPPNRQWEQAVELVDVEAGRVAMTAGHRGRWITGVIHGTLATTVPPRLYQVGEVFVHDGCTAVLSPTGAQCLSVDARHDLADALISRVGVGEAPTPPRHGTASRASHPEATARR